MIPSRCPKSRGAIDVGSGTFNITDGNSVIWLCSGIETVSIGAASSSDPAGALDTQIRTRSISGLPRRYQHRQLGRVMDAADYTGFIHGETGGSTLAAADIVRLGHIDPVSRSFVVGDLSGPLT